MTEGKVIAFVRAVWYFPKIEGTLFGVPILRIKISLGLYWGPLFWETTK